MQTGEQLKRIVNDGGDSQIVINSAVLDVAMSSDGVQLATVGIKRSNYLYIFR